MGSVIRPAAVSPVTSGKSCAWIVENMSIPLQHTAAREMWSNDSPGPMIPYNMLVPALTFIAEIMKLTHNPDSGSLEGDVAPNVTEILPHRMRRKSHLVVGKCRQNESESN